jgi:hypothetical protein
VYGFLFLRWASSLTDGCILFNNKEKRINHQAKCLMCVGTKTVTVIFLGALAKEWQLKNENNNLVQN